MVVKPTLIDLPGEFDNIIRHFGPTRWTFGILDICTYLGNRYGDEYKKALFNSVHYDRTSEIRLIFNDPRDAMLFKLAHGG